VASLKLLSNEKDEEGHLATQSKTKPFKKYSEQGTSHTKKKDCCWRVFSSSPNFHRIELLLLEGKFIQFFITRLFRPSLQETNGYISSNLLIINC